MTGFYQFAAGIIAVVLLGASLTLPVHAEPWNTPYDGFFEDPDLNAEFRTLDDGTEIRSVLLPGSVRLEERREDGAISRFTLDTSGAGAILCTREIFLIVKTMLEACADLENPKVSNRLEAALGRIDDFVVANSVEPVSLSQLQENEKARLAEFRTEMGGAPEGDKIASCRSADQERFRFGANLSKKFGNLSDADFQEVIDGTLAVPRLPAMNPCL